jgi:predicted nucleic acid-binding protein
MRERFPGYYRPSDEEFTELWDTALIVPDTNVLLTFYRLAEPTRAKLIEILERLQERLFVPYQVAHEFQNRRIGVIEDQMKAYENVEKAIGGFAAEVGRGMRQHPRLDKQDLESRIADALKPVMEHLSEVRAGHPDPLEDDDPLGPDAIRDALEPLIAGRIGEPRDLERLTAEGRERYERKQPPGWADEKKPEPQRYGDLAIWLEILERAEREGRAVILVTEERKPDWWWVHEGRSLGPRLELVEEMRERTGQRFYLYGVERFMEEAAKALGIEFSEDERDDVVRAETFFERFEPTHVHTASGERHPLVTMDRAAHQAFDRSFKMYSGIGDEYLYLPNLKFPGWNASARVDGTSVLLRVAWEPHAIAGPGSANRLLCMVTDPNGDSTVASRRDTSYTATFRYPDNFSAADAALGAHSYRWYFIAEDDAQPEEIARGTFELSLPEEDEGEDRQ